MNQKKVIPTWLNALCFVLIVGCLVWTIYSMFETQESQLIQGESAPAPNQEMSQDMPAPEIDNQEMPQDMLAPEIDNQEIPQDMLVSESDSENVRPESIPEDPVLLDITTILALVAALIYCLLGYRKNASLFFKIFLYLFMIHIFVDAIDVNAPYLVQCICVIQFGLICALSLSINLGKTRSYIYTLSLIICVIAKIIVFLIGLSELSSGSISELILMMIMGIMVYAKYQDKAARGTN